MMCHFWSVTIKYIQKFFDIIDLYTVYKNIF